MVEMMRLATIRLPGQGKNSELRPPPQDRMQLLLGIGSGEVCGLAEESEQLAVSAGERENTPDQGFATLQHMGRGLSIVDDYHSVVVYDPPDGIAERVDAPFTA